MSHLLLEAKGISKAFPGVKALKQVNLQIEAGEIHGLIGENGAGKSTIIKILAGVYTPDEGSVWFMGEDCNNEGIEQSLSRGISVIYQELCLVPYMTVYENIILGFEPCSHGFYAKTEARNRAARVLEELELDLPLDTQVGRVEIAVQQMVEIAKAFSRNAKLIIMDEPTSSLTNKEVEKLYCIMRKLKDKGVSILFVSHKLEEVSYICDRVTVFRDGQSIVTRRITNMTRDQMVYAMVGREITNYYTVTHTPGTEVVLQVRDLSKRGYVNHVDFHLCKGEVLGFTGLIGAGRTETAQLLFGLNTPDSGEILLHGKPVRFRGPHEAVEAGVALVPENRKEQGIFPLMGVSFNMTIVVLREFMKRLRVNKGKEEKIIQDYMKALRVKASSPSQHISNLSGGNQQKVIFGRWLATKPDVLILDEPTRGVDISAKTEIYGIIDELAKSGVSIIMISSELPEIINISDRIVVMSRGAVVATLDSKEDFSQETIMNYCVGGPAEDER